MTEDTQQDINIAIAAKDIEYIKKSLTRIEEQTTKTNGRVGALERWKAWATGGAVVLVAVFGLVTWSIFAVANAYMEKIDDKVSEYVSTDRNI